MELILADKTVCLVDEEMLPYVCKFKWRTYKCNSSSGGYFYIARRDNKGKFIFMHREITNAEKGEVVDHINGDTRDNRKQNLRVCSHAQNMINRKMHKNNKTGFKGVHEAKPGLFRARIKFGKISKSLGCYKTAEEAHQAYIAASKKFHGDFSFFNRFKIKDKSFF